MFIKVTLAAEGRVVSKVYLGGYEVDQERRTEPWAMDTERELGAREGSGHLALQKDEATIPGPEGLETDLFSAGLWGCSQRAWGPHPSSPPCPGAMGISRENR